MATEIAFYVATTLLFPQLINIVSKYLGTNNLSFISYYNFCQRAHPGDETQDEKNKLANNKLIRYAKICLVLVVQTKYCVIGGPYKMEFLIQFRFGYQATLISFSTLRMIRPVITYFVAWSASSDTIVY